MKQGEKVVDRNVYWLSTQADLVDWPATLGKPQAMMSQFADLSALQGLPGTELNESTSTHSQPGPNGADTVTEVTITNISKTPTVGFFLRADIRRGNAAGVPATATTRCCPSSGATTT